MMASNLTHPTKRTWLSWAVPAISGLVVIGVLTTVIVFLCEIVGTGITGKEFNPYTFETREFAYRQSIITRRQIKGITRTTSQDNLSSYISSQSWFPPSTKTRWDLAEDSTVTKDSLDWRSQPWLRLLQDPEFQSYWLDWSSKNPDLAPSLWLSIVELARQDQYEAIPLVFDAVFDLQEADSFVSTIEETLASAYRLAADSTDDPQKAAVYRRLAAESFRNRLP
jgi:hypothetical protein